MSTDDLALCSCPLLRNMTGVTLGALAYLLARACFGLLPVQRAAGQD